MLRSAWGQESGEQSLFGFERVWTLWSVLVESGTITTVVL